MSLSLYISFLLFLELVNTFCYKKTCIKIVLIIFVFIPIIADCMQRQRHHHHHRQPGQNIIFWREVFFAWGQGKALVFSSSSSSCHVKASCSLVKLLEYIHILHSFFFLLCQFNKHHYRFYCHVKSAKPTVVIVIITGALFGVSSASSPS